MPIATKDLLQSESPAQPIGNSILLWEDYGKALTIEYLRGCLLLNAQASLLNLKIIPTAVSFLLVF